MKKLLTLILALVAFCAIGQVPLPASVEDMGDIYVIVVDKSGSMRNGKILNSALNRLPKALSNVDFSKDVFLFLTSGFQSKANKDVPTKRLWSKEPSFQEGFIHHTDNTLYSFRDANAVVRHLRRKNIINPSESGLASFGYQMSYVSQIRVSALVRTLDYLKAQQWEQRYNSIKILSITDDACQNDQWAIDYRKLKSDAPDKLDSISKINSKYIYTQLNPAGAGEMTEIYSDEQALPHLWLYQYTSRQMMPDTLSDFKIGIRAVDGRSVELTTRQQEYKGDQICFFHIDSLVVNGKVAHFDAEFVDSAILETEYDNRFRSNNVELYGFMQVAYQDKVLGPHFKRVEIAQQSKVLSGKQSVVLEILFYLLVMSVLVWAVYYWIVRPRRVVARLYLPNERVVTLLSGFAREWKQEFVPLISALHPVEQVGPMEFIIHRHRRISVKSGAYSCSTPDETIIESRRPLKIAAEHCYDLNQIRQSILNNDNSNRMLMDVCRNTLFAKFIEKWGYSRRQKLVNFVASLLQRLAPRYYYHIKSLGQDIYFSSPYYTGLHYGIQNDEQLAESQKRSSAIARALESYYSGKEAGYYDALLCVEQRNSNVEWNLVMLSSDGSVHPKLNYVQTLLSFSNKGVSPKGLIDDIRFVKRNLRRDKALRRILKDKKVGVVQTNYYDCSSHCFNILPVKCPGYVYLVEDSNKRRSQLFYSSFEDDGSKAGRYVAIREGLLNGWLYLSLLPFDIIRQRSYMSKIMSAKVIHTDDNNLSPVTVNKGVLYYRGEEYKIE